MLPGALLEDPTKLDAALAQHSEIVQPALDQAAFILYSQPYTRDRSADAVAQAMLGSLWHCAGGVTYAVCQHNGLH